MTPLTRADFEKARAIVAPKIHKTPLLTSRILSERTGFDVVFNAFRQAGKQELESRAPRLRLHTDLLPFGGALEPRVEASIGCLQAGELGGNELV